MGVALLTRNQSGMAFVGMERHDGLHRQEDDQEQSRKVAPDIVARVHFGGKNTTFSHQKATDNRFSCKATLFKKKSNFAAYLTVMEVRLFGREGKMDLRQKGDGRNLKFRKPVQGNYLLLLNIYSFS